MKRFLILAFLPLLAWAAPTDNMVLQCSQVMDAGVCRVALDPNDYPGDTIVFLLNDGSVRRVRKEVYLAVRALGFKKDAQGRWLMCSQILTDCAQWDSERCLAQRALWRQ